MNISESEVIHQHLAKALKRHKSVRPGECLCTVAGNHIVPRFARHPGQNLKVVVYIRAETDLSAAEFQRHLIRDYCQEHGYEIAAEFVDIGKPSLNLHSAIEALGASDALAIANLDRVVEHPRNRMRDLRPFIHHFFCDGGKHLVSVQEGIDTSCVAGQKTALDLVNSLKDEIEIDAAG